MPLENALTVIPFPPNFQRRSMSLSGNGIFLLSGNQNRVTKQSNVVRMRFF